MPCPVVTRRTVVRVLPYLPTRPLMPCPVAPQRTLVLCAYAVSGTGAVYSGTVRPYAVSSTGTGRTVCGTVGRRLCLRARYAVSGEGSRAVRRPIGLRVACAACTDVAYGAAYAPSAQCARPVLSASAREVQCADLTERMVPQIKCMAQC
eukprot:1768644-Rhodomonas_salina.1